MSRSDEENDSSSVIPKMEIPQFEPLLTVEDVESLKSNPNLQKVLLAMNVLERKIDFLLRWMPIIVDCVRTIQLQVGPMKWRWSLLRWIGMTITAGLIAGAAKSVFR